jgi:hypothetical protein
VPDFEIMPIVYKYFDGSGNAYTIMHDVLTYDPVPKDKSSSINYHGGEPAETKIGPGEFHSIESLLNHALQLTEIHIENRVMLSGVIVHYSETATTEVILRPGCREVFNIEKALNNLIKKPG